MPVCVPVDMPIRDVMEIRYLTGYPVLIRDGDEMTGVIGDRELYHTLLGKMLSDDD
jgi:glycine betaine/proline transport system ATP-binding protein